MSNLFARARRYESLTPAERALLRLLEALASVALVGAATAAAQYLAAPLGSGLAAIDWWVVARVCAAGAAVAVLMALAKYFKAHGDPALASALDTIGTRIATAVPPPLAAQPATLQLNATNMSDASDVGDPPDGALA